MAGSPSLVRSEGRQALIAQALQKFTYDKDGNLESDGIWNYSYDAENRLIVMTTSPLAVSPGGFPNMRVEFKYDYLGRRVQKRSVNFTEGRDTYTRYLYDGWNLIAEFNAPSGTSCGDLLRSYTWGLDLTGSVSATGGVGALVQIADHTTSTTYLPTYDGNGNVVALLNAADGTAAAKYEYSPFGELLRVEGSFATKNPFRFSTKFTDDETGLVYYGYRYYSPSMGRFINRDPIEESGGMNLYGFCGNDGVSSWDVLGQARGAAVIMYDGGAGAENKALLAGDRFRDPVYLTMDKDDIADLWEAAKEYKKQEEQKRAQPKAAVPAKKSDAPGKLRGTKIIIKDPIYEGDPRWTFTTPARTEYESGRAFFNTLAYIVNRVSLYIQWKSFAATGDAQFAEAEALILTGEIFGMLARSSPLIRNAAVTRQPSTIGELMRGMDPDTMIHLTVGADAFSGGVEIGSWWARLGDVRNLSVLQYRIGVVGPCAAGYGPGANLFLTAPSSPIFKLESMSAFGYPEYINTSIVTPSRMLRVPSGPPLPYPPVPIPTPVI